MMSFKKILLTILFADALVMGLVFSVSGFYNTNVDTVDYVKQINYHEGNFAEEDTSLARREFKPLYGILGSLLVPFVTPETAILLLNISFFVGLSIFFFLFLECLSFNSRYALIGTFWLISGYPLLKYGLALGTDLSGWFFAVLGAYLGILGLQRGKLWPLALASVVGFVGFLTKETGILGLGFAGLSVLFSFNHREINLFLKRVLAVSVPFLVLESLYVWHILSKGGLTFFDWYQINAEGIHSYQTIRYLVMIEGASFHIVAVLALVGLIFAIINREIISRLWLSKFLPLFAVSLPMLAWPIYITRILYIQFLFVIPLALYGFEKIMEKIVGKYKKLLFGLIAIAPVVASLTLFFIGHSRSLFDLFSF